MDLHTSITPGITGTIEYLVDENSTARSLVSGTVEVLGTPALIRLMEAAAVQALEGRLPPGSTTVGAYIAVHHTAPTPVGMRVRVTATVSAVEGRRITFDLVAHDEVEPIGHGTHQRVLVDMERFTANALRKRAGQEAG
ncbi:MAG: thioesterase family protein [Anaerolineae bacterium]|nr:thioesterase family protein [Anaerolineae bacterium]